MYYVVKYSGPFGFIKPWSAVRDAGGGETYSQQFLTPSIVEGIRQKLGVEKILRHRLTYISVSVQQEMVQAKGWLKKNKMYGREKSILKRGVLVEPTLSLAFETAREARKAYRQHICLCRNEDILLPEGEIVEIPASDFDTWNGYELRFEENEKSFLVGYNRFEGNKEMYGWIQISGEPIKTEHDG